MHKENVVIYTMEYYSAVKNNDIRKFAGKWMEPEIIILSELMVTVIKRQALLEHTIYHHNCK
ncbi:hypothetical protein STEG23_010149, partial [Scotinomys teguina]